MSLSDFKMFRIAVESYDEKTAENYRNCYVAEKLIVSKLSKISIPNLYSTNRRKEGVYTFQKISRQRALRSGWLGQARPSSSFIMIQLVLYWTQKFISIFPDFLMVLELFECRRGDPYIWLLLRTSFDSLTRKNEIKVIVLNSLYYIEKFWI